jgi:hypothetical protein
MITDAATPAPADPHLINIVAEPQASDPSTDYATALPAKALESGLFAQATMSSARDSGTRKGNPTIKVGITDEEKEKSSFSFKPNDEISRESIGDAGNVEEPKLNFAGWPS